jgi:hypothetical protein
LNHFTVPFGISLIRQEQDLTLRQLFAKSKVFETWFALLAGPFIAATITLSQCLLMQRSFSGICGCA